MSSEFIKEKAREISYALVRVAFYIKRLELRDRIEGLAFELLDDAAKASVENSAQAITGVLSTIASLDVLVRLAHSIYEIEPVNATIIVRELNNLNSAIRQFGKLDEHLPNLESLFSHSSINNPVAAAINLSGDFQMSNDVKTSESSVAGSGDENVYKNESISEDSAGAGSSLAVTGAGSTVVSRIGQDTNQALNIAMRQASIVDKIRARNGSGMRLKDILAEFRNVSERTIRYDLQGLCEKGVIERVGNGGPATYYRITGSPAIQL